MAGQIPTKGVQPKSAPTKRAPAKKAPSKAVAKVTKPEDKSDFTPAKAKAHTEKIKKGAQTTFEDIIKAYQGRIWLALDLKSWDEYCETQLASAPIAIPREKKKATVVSLTQAGLSTRAIEAATGIPQNTAAVIAKKAREAEKAAQGDQNGSPDNVIDAEVVEEPPLEGMDEFAPEATESEPEARTVQGKDGKTYTVTDKPKATINIVSAARNVAKELDNVRTRLDALFSRDDYEENQVQVQGTLETAVSDFLDTVAEDFIDLLRQVVAESEPEPEPAL